MAHRTGSEKPVERLSKNLIHNYVLVLYKTVAVNIIKRHDEYLSNFFEFFGPAWEPTIENMKNNKALLGIPGIIGLNMGLDLQFIWAHYVHSCIDWLRPRNPLFPSHLGSEYEGGRYWSAKIDDISLRSPACNVPVVESHPTVRLAPIGLHTDGDTVQLSQTNKKDLL